MKQRDQYLYIDFLEEEELLKFVNEREEQP